jgi:hypothetical protein
MYESQLHHQQQQQQQQQDDKHTHHQFQQQLIQAQAHGHGQGQQPEPNTYDYASQLMFDANAFAAISHTNHHQMDLNSAATAAAAAATAAVVAAGGNAPSYLDFLPTNSNNNDPYEMFRYQAAIQQSHDYASSCSTTSNNYQHAAAYPMMAFHNDGGLTLENSNTYPIPYDHHHNHPYMFQGGPMPTLSTSSSSSSSLSSSNTSNTAYNNDNRGAQVYVRKACVSCKQSHVACDVQRPCARCVRLNKADTCVDAERKKRGRPCGSSKKKKDISVSNAAVLNSAAAAANMISYL